MIHEFTNNLFNCGSSMNVATGVSADEATGVSSNAQVTVNAALQNVLEGFTPKAQDDIVYVWNWQKYSDIKQDPNWDPFVSISSRIGESQTALHFSKNLYKMYNDYTKPNAGGMFIISNSPVEFFIEAGKMLSFYLLCGKPLYTTDGRCITYSTSKYDG
jgi:hypothetical protein